ncbi:MAG: group 1 glycosyl transferase [Candidatus Omnitrophica bacterium CG_4_8_14_3_um_filter_43_15]|nr:MAG: hypothetical protein AUJ89_03280 [Candidatus Omnitrophica bacterium CG1_02_43_210]PIV39909.1 MAG: group 1 glycosyl transferase [Candidatus Omnitrophica bacterium CG02_land_8_20_14_3_00__42_8]PIW68394.1 MAG: group 1 glycosyl transferase [Candidatus Omnitrophica bacterium CG12_big_fil_rev_8_21_14_0_65_42_8]PIW80289.1 MAG: group 1 glycosyl transferase [Candidatus Omnitrophica bacterium CG_4_8_14_3_um_filter_43_15]
MKVLFIVPYSSKGPSNRFRVEQYFPYLKAENIDYDISPFAFDKFYGILYVKGNFCKKTDYFIKAILIRFLDIIRAHRYDVVFIHREACPFGPPVFEWIMHLLGKPIIFDFDDAIFLPNYNPVNRFYRFLKFPSKTRAIIKMSSVVIVANRFLEEYARKFNNSVHILPTPIDTKKFFVSEKKSERLTIGWIGSPTTAFYLKIIFNVMERLSAKYDFILKIVGAKQNISVPGVKVENYDWSLEKEAEDFQSIDIGIYPLIDNQWAYGKAGFKAIQYMSVGVPVVASPVGMINEFISDEKNGFLAATEDQWFEKLSRLIEDVPLRRTTGLAGRKTVEEMFSAEINAKKYIGILKNAKK